MKLPVLPTLTERQLAELKVAESEELVRNKDDFWKPLTRREALDYAMENFTDPVIRSYYLGNVKTEDTP